MTGCSRSGSGARAVIPNSTALWWRQGLLLLSALIAVPWSLALAQSIGARAPESRRSEVRATAVVESVVEEAARWNITESEYARYQLLMRGFRGRVSAPRITPIEVLGIHAQSDAERRRYAELWVRLIREDTARVLEFSNAVHAAHQRYRPDEPLIDRGRINALRAAAGSRWGPLDVGRALASDAGRMMLFTARECLECRRPLDELLAQVATRRIAGLDIYLTDVSNGDHAIVQRWAAANGIPIAALADGAVTLNFDGGVSAAVAARLGRRSLLSPTIIRRHADRYEAVSLTEL